MSTASATIWLVGGKKAEAREQKQLIEQLGALEVGIIPVRERADEYADLAANPDTGAVLISESIFKRSGHAYSGDDLATFLRTLRADLPIYLLTDDDDEAATGSFDGVIAAADLRRRPEVYSRRLLRAAGRYQAALQGRQRRLQELLDRQIADTLSPADAAELAELRADAERAAQVKLAKHAERAELDLVERRTLVEQLEALAERLEGRQGT